MFFTYHLCLLSDLSKTHHFHFSNITNYNFQYIDVPSISLDYNRLPFWYAKNKGPDDSLDDHRSNLLGNYILSKRTQEKLSRCNTVQQRHVKLYIHTTLGGNYAQAQQLPLNQKVLFHDGSKALICSIVDRRQLVLSRRSCQCHLGKWFLSL